MAKTAAIDREVAVLQALQCQTIHQGYPEGTTCFDQQRHARLNRSEYAVDFRRRILRGECLCERCACVAALLSMPLGETLRTLEGLERPGEVPF